MVGGGRCAHTADGFDWQIYFSQRLASRVRFAQMLLDFQKADVSAGDTVSVVIKVPVTGLEMWSGANNKYVVEDSSYDIMVGQYVTDPHMQTHQLTIVH